MITERKVIMAGCVFGVALILLLISTRTRPEHPSAEIGKVAERKRASALETSSRERPVTSPREILEIRDEGTRKKTLENYLKTHPDKWSEVLGGFFELSKQGKRFDAEWATFWAVISDQDPLTSIDMANTVGRNSPWRESVLQSIIGKAFAYDPVSAAAFIDDEKNGISKVILQNLINPAIGGYLKSQGPEAASIWLASIEQKNPGITQKGWYTIAREVVQKNGDGALDSWLSSLPAVAKKGGIEAASVEKSQLDAKAAALWLSPLMQDNYNPQAINNIAYRYAFSEPVAALDWAFSIPPNSDNGYYAGIGTVIDAVLKTDQGQLNGIVSRYEGTPYEAAITSAILKRKDQIDPKYLPVFPTDKAPK